MLSFQGSRFSRRWAIDFCYPVISASSVSPADSYYYTRIFSAINSFLRISRITALRIKQGGYFWADLPKT